MRKKAQEKFIRSYETRIKNYRDEYYRNIAKQGLLNTTRNTQELAYDILPLLIGIIFILLFNFSIKGTIISLIIIFIGNLVITTYRKIKHINYSNYKNELRKIGYFNIQDYEDKVKKYITGPNGYYKNELDKILSENNQTIDTVDKILDSIGNQNFIWTDSDEDTLNIVNSSLNSRPKLKKIRYVHIRYYRLDKNTNRVILKTDIEKLTFNRESIQTFDKIIKEKKFESKMQFDPVDYINDFELFMHNIKRDLDVEVSNNQENKKEAQTELINNSVILTIGLVIAIVAPKYKLISSLIILISLISFNKNIREFLTFQNKRLKTEEEYINYLNNNIDCINEFNELKLSLNIPANAYKVYSPEGACYLTWVANGYFHIFLNLIYFNTVYMVVKNKDVEYYQVTKNECIVKLKDKKLCFTKECEEVFKRILPNKDYDWIKGITNNK